MPYADCLMHAVFKVGETTGRCFLALLVMFLISGCGSKFPVTARVNGTVSYGGKPVGNGTILFTPEAKGNAATGEIRADGSFQLTTFQRNDGAVVGTYKVSMFVNPPGEPGNPGQEFAGGKPPIPVKYNSPTTSDLKVTINSGENKLDLKLND